MKKMFSLLCVCILLASMTACGGTENIPTADGETTTTTEAEIIISTTTETTTFVTSTESSTIETTTSNKDEPYRNENLDGRGYSAVRSEPDYVNVIGYVALSYQEENELEKTDQFADESLWKIPTYEKDKQIWSETGEYLPHKTEVVVTEQFLKHEGHGTYTGYLLVKSLDDDTEYYINVRNYITKPYWSYDNLIDAAKVGCFVAKYNQVSDLYPVTQSNDPVEMPDGTIVFVTGVSGASSTVKATVWKEWRYGYGGVEVNFQPDDLQILF